MKTPMISVIMPVYNEAAYVTEAIRSILNQSYSNFEFLIFDDGSTDQSLEKIKAFKDTRIRIFSYSINQGYVIHLNRGIMESRGKYIARMDADDIAMPDRFERQVAYLEKHPEISILGGWYRNFGSQLVQKYPLEHEAIKTTMLTACPVVHPTVMMRRSCLLEHRLFYHPDYLYSEDFELWSRAIHHLKFANLPRVLIQRRIHGNNVSILHNNRQRRQSSSVRRRWIQDLVNQEQLLHTIAFLEGKLKIESLLRGDIQTLLQSIKSANLEKKVFQPAFLDAQLNYIYFMNCVNNLIQLEKYLTAGSITVFIGVKWSFLRYKFIRTIMLMKIKRVFYRFWRGEKSIAQQSVMLNLESHPISAELDLELK